MGPFSKGIGSASYDIVAIKYFTRWVEKDFLAKITESNTSKFLWKNIICRFGILDSIVSINGKHFDNKKVTYVLSWELKAFLSTSLPSSKWSG